MLTTRIRPENDKLVLGVVLALTALAFLPMLRGGFLTDDYQVIRLVSEEIALDDGVSLANLGRLARAYVERPSGRFDVYRPTVPLVFALHLMTTGTRPLPFLLTNLLIHLGSGALLFSLLRRLFADLPVMAAGAATLLFLVSPLQVEPVAWSASRSDTLSLFFGLASMVTLLGSRGRRRILSTACLAVSLSCKEVAVVYVVALLMIELRFAIAERAGGGAGHRFPVKAFLCRAAPVVLVAGLYLFVRFLFFGGLLENEYNRQSYGDYFRESGLFASYALSVSRVLMPISRNVIETDGLRLAIGGAMALGFVALSVLGLRDGWRRDRVAVGIAVLFMTLPFFLAVTINPISPTLLHSRAAHPLLVGFAILAALALRIEKRRRIALSAAIGLTVCTASLVLPMQKGWVKAVDRMERTIGSVRDPLRDLPNPSAGGVAILGYRDARYYGDSFNMEGSFKRALQRPFLSRDFFLTKVGATTGGGLAGQLAAFGKLLSKPTDGIAFFQMGTSGDGDLECELISAGRYCRVSGGRLDLTRPALGHTLELVGARPETLSPEFVFWTRGIEPASFELGLVSHTARFANFRFPREQFEARDIPDGVEYTLRLTPEIVRPQIGTAPQKTLFGWYVTARDAEGRAIAGTEMRPLIIASRP